MDLELQLLWKLIGSSEGWESHACGGMVWGGQWRERWRG